MTNALQDDIVASAIRFLGNEEQTDVPQSTAGTLSVRLVAAHEHGHNAGVLSVHGDIDLETAPVLREALVAIVEREAGPVVVDLSEVEFMDSTGVHVLVDALRRLEPQNRPLATVCREGGSVHRLLALVGLVDALAVHRSRETALIGGGDRLRPTHPAVDLRAASGSSA